MAGRKRIVARAYDGRRANLRKKVEMNPDYPEYIGTEPWVGYRFNGLPRLRSKGGEAIASRSRR